MDVREKLVELLSYFADGYSVENRHIVGGQKVCEIVDHLIAHGVTVQEWISVKDGLPEKGEEFLCVFKNGRIYDGYRSDSFYGDFIISGVSYVNIFFTHWMSCPNRRKENDYER